MQIVRLAPLHAPPRLRPAAIVLAALVNGGLLTVIALSRQSVPSPAADAVIEVVLVATKSAPEAPRNTESQPKDKPSPKKTAPTPGRDNKPAAPRPGTLPVNPEDDAQDTAPPLWTLVCAMVPPDLRARRPDCREGDPFARRVGRVTAGTADQSIRERDIGNLMGGRFAGKDRYQIEVMLGLRSTKLGTKYHVPVDHGPADKPIDHTDTDRIIGPSPIPDG